MDVIRFHLTDAAQRAARLAGQPAASAQEFEVPNEALPRLLTLPWTKMGFEGQATCEVPPDVRGWLGGLWLDVPRGAGMATSRPTDAEAAIHHGEAVAALVAAAEEAARDRMQREAAEQQEAQEARCAAEAAQKVRQEAQEAQRKAREAAEKTRLALLAGLHGDASARARIAASGPPLGLLPEKEAIQIVANWALPPTIETTHGAVQEFCLGADAVVRGTCKDICPCCFPNSRRCTVSWLILSPEGAGGLSAGEHEQVEQIEQALAGIDLKGQPRVHQGQCSDRYCDHEAGEGRARLVGVLVRRDVGDGLVVEREYALAPGAGR